VWALVLFGENAAFAHGTGKERTLAKGDMVLIDTGGSLHGYCSDITRTWACGSASDEARRAWDTVLAAQAAAFEQLRPGVACEAVDAAARKVITDAGYGEGYTSFWHRLGHGIGLQGHEHPYLVPGNARLLRPGMTMSNEPGIYVRGAFGVRIEDIIAITEDGHRVFGEKATW
jgi:Xaa-Pro dipeptidase